MAAGGGPPEENDVNIGDFVKDSPKNRKFFGALCAHIVNFLDVCRRRAPIFFDWKFGPIIRFQGPPPPRIRAPAPPPARTVPAWDT